MPPWHLGRASSVGSSGLELCSGLAPAFPPAVEFSGLLSLPGGGFPSNAVMAVLCPGRRPSAGDEEQKSLLFPGVGEWNWGSCVALWPAWIRP